MVVESIIEIRWNPIFLKNFYWRKIIPASGQLIFWLVETILSPFFRDSYQWKRLIQGNPSCWLVETDFQASENRFLFVQRFFLMESVTEISGSQL